jgi:hypothetical protein
MNAEVAYLRDRCRLILDAIERSEPGTFIVQLRQIVEDTAAKGNTRGMRTIRRDLLEMSQGLPAEVRAALQAELKAQEVTDPSQRPG